MQTRFLLILASFFIASSTYAQSSNVDCATAFEIPDADSWCSGLDEYDNVNAGKAGVPDPACFGSFDDDLWFSFDAILTSVNIGINAEVGGDMDNPQVALYQADDCSSFGDPLACDRIVFGDEVISIFVEDLIIGAKYYIRVTSTRGEEGSFQICVNSFNVPAEPGQDCVDAAILCNKESFGVQAVTGAGADPNEGIGTCLDEFGLGTSEDQSTWFKWTCKESGTLTFDLTPLLVNEDMDFALFHLPNGINSCEKDVIRCNATAGGIGLSCGFKTGLDLTSLDTEEDLNCDAGEDGYLRFIDMVAGESYALLVNNFSETENGFDVSFGGTGTFEGPEAAFEITRDSNNPCGDEFVFVDVSTSGISAISDLEWDFGMDASPPTGNGPGPHTVTYGSEGEKNIILAVISDAGCIVTQIQSIEISDCLNNGDDIEINLENMVDPSCDGGIQGTLEVSGGNGCPDYEFNIDGGAFSSNAIFTGLDSGDHTIGIIDGKGCDNFAMFTLASSAPIAVDAGDDVTISSPINFPALNATTATNNVTVSWDPPNGISCSDATTNCLNPVVNPLVTTTYTITIVDENGCTATDMVTVIVDLCPGGSDLSFTLDSIQDIVCPGEVGFISVSGLNGDPNYQFNLNGGDFINSGNFTDLPAGNYTINIVDDSNCSYSEQFDIGNTPDFEVSAGDDLIIEQAGDAIQGSGSTTAINPTSISWEPADSLSCPDGSNTCLNPIFNPLETTTFTLTIVDENGCINTDEILITVIPRAIDVSDVYQPNIFSPNQDGINDIFTLLGDPELIQGIEELAIFDRWGNKVYVGFNLGANDPFNGWDGRLNRQLVDQGVYVWYAKVKYIINEEILSLSGDVTLIR